MRDELSIGACAITIKNNKLVKQQYRQRIAVSFCPIPEDIVRQLDDLSYQP